MSVIIITGGDKAKALIDAVVAASANSQLTGENLCACQAALDTLKDVLATALESPPLDQPPPGP